MRQSSRNMLDASGLAKQLAPKSASLKSSGNLGQDFQVFLRAASGTNKDQEPHRQIVRRVKSDGLRQLEKRPPWATSAP